MIEKNKSSSYEIDILSPDESLKEWDHFVDDAQQGCIFCRSWWLKAVCQDSFTVLTLRKGDRIVAGMPIPTYRKWGNSIVHMPPLTQTLGVILAPPTSGSYERRLSNEMNTLDFLVDVIPKFGSFSMNFHYNFTNWLPFYWSGYTQTVFYTYVILDLTDLNRVFSEFAHAKKYYIRKAEKLVSVYTDLSAKEFYANHILTLRKQGKQIDYSFDFFKSIYDATYKNGCGKTWYALDNQGSIHAAIFVVFDSKSAYYLMSTIDPDFRSSGATTLLIRDAIAYVSQYTNRFDFEGSMIPGVEHSFRKFGAIQTPYFRITKSTLAIKSLIALRSSMISGMRRLKRSKH